MAVVDSGQLVRGLYLVVQLLELEVPVVIALNMIDEVAANPPLPDRIAAMLGVPCVATRGRSGAGIGELSRAIGEALAAPPQAASAGPVRARPGGASRCIPARTGSGIHPAQAQL